MPLGAGAPQLEIFNQDGHFRTVFHTIALPKSGVLILEISKGSSSTQRDPLIALECDLDVTRCNEHFFSVRSRTQLSRSIFPRARSWRGLTETVANPEILYMYRLSNESAGEGDGTESSAMEAHRNFLFSAVR